MKNKLILETGKDKIEYNPLIKIALEEKEYIIYTKGELNECGDIICYGATYNFVNGKQIVEPIKEDETLEFLDSILMQIQEIVNKKESSE